MLLLSHDDKIKTVGIRYEAYAPEPLVALARAVARGRESKDVEDFSEALALVDAATPPPLKPAERTLMKVRLARLQELNAPSIVTNMVDFELNRAAFLARAEDKGAWLSMYPLFALRDRMDVSHTAFAALEWLLEPHVRGRSVDHLSLEGLAGAEELRQARIDSGAASVDAPETLRLLFGTERFEVDGLNILGPSEFGTAAKLGTNANSPSTALDVQARLEAALPQDFGPLFPEWRRTWPFSFHDTAMTLSFAGSEDAARYLDEMRRDANWAFVRRMRDASYALDKIRAFRARAARRGWWVSATDALDA